MSEILNPKILDKLRSSIFDDNIKDFLEEMLFFELEQFEEGSPKYSKKYDEAIMKYAKKGKEGKNEI